MTILEALKAVSTYPILANAIDVLALERGITGTSVEATTEILLSDAYRLTKADVYLWLYTSPDIREQEVSFTQAERDNFLYLANLIYADLEDPKFFGKKLGFAGENYNGF